MINRGGLRVVRGCFDEGYVIEYKQSNNFIKKESKYEKIFH